MRVGPLKCPHAFSLLVRAFLNAEQLEPHLRLIQEFPSAGHPLGRDGMGRDFLGICCEAISRSLTYSIIATIAAMSLGTFMALAAVLQGGLVDRTLSHIGDSFKSIDVRLVIFMLNASFELTLSNVYLVFTLFAWMHIMDVVRGQVLVLLPHDFVEASRLLGASNWHLARVHLLPHLTPFLLLNFVDTINSFLLNEGFIYALGFSCGKEIALGALMSPQMIDPARYYDDRSAYVSYVPEI